MMTLVSSSLAAVFLSCVGPSADGSLVYVAQVFRSAEAATPETARLWSVDPRQGWLPLGAYAAYDDLTPSPPTDVFYHYVFRDDDAAAGSLALSLMAGGFTQRATAQVVRYGEDGEALGTMNCQEGS